MKYITQFTSAKDLRNAELFTNQILMYKGEHVPGIEDSESGSGSSWPSDLPLPNEDGSWSDELKDAWNEKYGQGGPNMGGTVDAEGLCYLNWSEEDIQYLQDHCPWNANQNADFVVSEYDKWFWDTVKTTYLGGDKDAAISQADWNEIMKNTEYASNVKFFPKINTSVLTEMYGSNSSSSDGSFCNWYSLYDLPVLDTTKVTDMSYMFYYC